MSTLMALIRFMTWWRKSAIASSISRHSSQMKDLTTRSGRSQDGLCCHPTAASLSQTSNNYLRRLLPRLMTASEYSRDWYKWLFLSKVLLSSINHDHKSSKSTYSPIFQHYILQFRVSHYSHRWFNCFSGNHRSHSLSSSLMPFIFIQVLLWSALLSYATDMSGKNLIYP